MTDGQKRDYSDYESNSAIVVRKKMSPSRGEVWQVTVYVDGKRYIRPGFKRRKAAVKLAAMMVQQALAHGWHVIWQVFDDQDRLTSLNLAALGSKMERGEMEHQRCSTDDGTSNQ